MPPIADPNVLVGHATADDAGVVRVSDDLALTLTVDFFTPVVDDPYWFGAIAAANSLSDTYAMGAAPFAALNLVAFPVKTLPMSVLEAVLKGGGDKTAEAGVSIVGGHTIEDAEPKYGMAVAGKVHPGRIVTNATARAGDVLLLTKPIGTGIISTAIKAGEAPKRVIDLATHVMATLNRRSAEAMLEVGPSACTDVTGYGLLGHLREMCAASRVGAKIIADAVPLIEGARDLAEQGMIPRGTYSNSEFVNGHVTWEDVDEVTGLVLCDAQTSGGLLIAVAADKRAAMQEALRKSGTMAAEIGELTEDAGGRMHVQASAGTGSTDPAPRRGTLKDPSSRGPEREGPVSRS